MKRISFNCFSGFKCISKRCQNNCCIGWEIDIDKKTLQKYKNVKGDFAYRLKKGIDFKNSQFKMKSDNGVSKCAFLNSEGLCDIITNLGEEYLCQVCRDHPRFKNFLSDRTECGIGLCCEEGARLLLNFDGKIEEIEQGESKRKLKGFEKVAFDFRKALLDKVRDRNKSIKERINDLLAFCKTDTERFFSFDFEGLFLGLERLNDRWENRIKNVKISLDPDIEKVAVRLEQLLVYFIYRHILRGEDETDLKSRAVFCVLSVLEIYGIWNNSKEKFSENFIETAREYSEEIEYSDDNVYKILDIADRFVVR